MRRNRRHYETHKEAARLFLEERVRYFNSFYSFPLLRIGVRNQKSRWGSCSRKGSLTFNYRLYFLPQTCADYVVVHELCHLQEFNHSPRFWALVAQTVPQYKEARQALQIWGKNL